MPSYGGGMAQTITQRELRNDSGEIMRRLDKGETLIVTRNGTPVGELTPLRRHRFVSADAIVAMFRNAPAIDAERFRTDLDAIATQDPAERARRQDRLQRAEAAFDPLPFDSEASRAYGRIYAVRHGGQMASRCRSTREPRAVAASAIPTVCERIRRRHGGRRARARGTTKVDADFNLLAADPG